MRSSDFVALISLDLVICSILMRSFMGYFPFMLRFTLSDVPVNRCVVAIFVGALIGLWIPVGSPALPLLGYVRGVTSDLSITSTILACLAFYRQLWKCPESAARERFWPYALLAVAAVVLYPTALGAGDWDAYRLGWGSPALLGGLAVTAFIAFGAGLRLLPLVLAAGVLAWSSGLLESNNLWDYLVDPWLVLFAWWQLFAIGIKALRKRIASF